MAASGLDVFAIDFTDHGGINAPSSQISSNLSFALSTSNVQTLWGNVQASNNIEGLLYVPDVDPACAPQSVVPPNVTRQSDFPRGLNAPFIAFAPWINESCTQAYLQTVQSGPNAIVFFLPSDYSTNTPPSVSSSVWTLPGSWNWGGWNTLPIYAVPGATGYTMMRQLSYYSGDLSSVPDSDQLSQTYGPSDYIRLWARFNKGPGNHYPTLWAFLLIVLGVVLVLLVITSISMRWKQRRNRSDLRQRILAGEVDVEMLGVKKSKGMSQADIDALPQVTYIPAEPSTDNHYDQPTCAICLEDYTANETKVRRLPCQHIYHPECIDPHLLSRSLCPVCKANVPRTTEPSQEEATPIPEITNAMVRQDRYIRHIRHRETSRSVIESPADIFQRRLGRPLFAPLGRAASRRQTRAVRPTTIEMTVTDRSPESIPLPPSPPSTPIPLAEPPPSRNTEARREWARRRASAMLSRQSRVNADQVERVAVIAEVEQTQANTPRWRRNLQRVFPGFT